MIALVAKALLCVYIVGFAAVFLFIQVTRIGSGSGDCSKCRNCGGSGCGKYVLRVCALWPAILAWALLMQYEAKYCRDPGSEGQK